MWGWFKPLDSTLSHFFREDTHASLCGAWAVMDLQDVEEGAEEVLYPDRCGQCHKLLTGNNYMESGTGYPMRDSDW